MYRSLRTLVGLGGDGAKKLILVLSEAYLTDVIGEGGSFMPQYGELAIEGAGTCTIKSALIRRTGQPRQSAHVFYDANGVYVALSELNADWDRLTPQGLPMSKFPIEGGIEIEVDVTVGAGGGGNLVLKTKGPNAPPFGVGRGTDTAQEMNSPSASQRGHFNPGSLMNTPSGRPINTGGQAGQFTPALRQFGWNQGGGVTPD